MANALPRLKKNLLVENALAINRLQLFLSQKAKGNKYRGAIGNIRIIPCILNNLNLYPMSQQLH